MKCNKRVDYIISYFKVQNTYTKSEAHISMISGWGIKTTRACAPVAPPSLAPLHMILVKFLIKKR